MKAFVFWIYFLPLSVSAGPLTCHVHSISVTDGDKISYLTESSGIQTLDLYQHHFEVKPDPKGNYLNYQIKETGGMPRASGLAPVPNVDAPFVLTYMDRADKIQFTLKCKN